MKRTIKIAYSVVLLLITGFGYWRIEVLKDRHFKQEQIYRAKIRKDYRTIKKLTEVNKMCVDELESWRDHAERMKKFSEGLREGRGVNAMIREANKR